MLVVAGQHHDYDIRTGVVMLPAPWEQPIEVGIILMGQQPWVLVNQVCTAALTSRHSMSVKPERLVELLQRMGAQVIRLDSNTKPELLGQLRGVGLVGRTTSRANMVRLDSLAAALRCMGKPRAAVGHLQQGYQSLISGGTVLGQESSSLGHSLQLIMLPRNSCIPWLMVQHLTRHQCRHHQPQQGHQQH